MQYAEITEWVKDWLGVTDKDEDERINKIVKSVIGSCSKKRIRVRIATDEDFDTYCEMIAMYSAPRILQTFAQKESYNRLAKELRRDFIILDGEEALEDGT